MNDNQNDPEHDEDKPSVVQININIFKINFYLFLIWFILRFFRENEFVNSAAQSLIAIILFINITFFYIIWIEANKK